MRQGGVVRPAVVMMVDWLSYLLKYPCIQYVSAWKIGDYEQ